MHFRTFLTIALVGTGSVANAATFTDRATFEAAIDILYIEDFETLTGGDSIAGPILMPTGLEVSTDTNDMYVAGPGQSSNPTTALGSNTPLSDAMHFDLGVSAYGLGMDIFQNQGGGSQTGIDQTYELSLFSGLLLVDTIVGTIGSGTGGFLGYTSASLFDNASLISLSTPLFEVVDNVTVGAVPLPAGLPLIGGAVLALGALRRRRKAT